LTRDGVDAAQRLTFGSSRFVRDGECVDQGLFHDANLPKKDLATLKHYAGQRLRLLTLRDFLCGRKDYAGLFRQIVVLSRLFVS